MVKKKQKLTINRNTRVTLLVVVIIFVAAMSWVLYQQPQFHKKKDAVNFPNSVVPYVDGTSAVSQVSVFYQDYIHPKNVPNFQKNLLNAAGNGNLQFYSQYYQHGFDPIVCSATMPLNVATSLASTGPVATVNAVAAYPDGSKAIIKVRVVLQDEGLKIDSVTCPGNKGNLPPSSN